MLNFNHYKIIELNMKYFLIALLLIIIIIYTITDRILYLYQDNNNLITSTNDNVIITYDNKNDKYNYIFVANNNTIEKLSNKIDDYDIFIKYSSIRNKLDTDKDYEKFYNYIDTIRDSIYINIIDNIIYDDRQLIEIIINDIEKTKLKYDFKKLKNIFVIKKINGNNTKLILFYDGLIYNNKKFKFSEDNFTGNTIVYKLDLTNKIINHHLQ
jgi:hypothetical protein